ncbi:MAG: hypothetical protein R3B92_02185 [Patescibacteria group bacterium]
MPEYFLETLLASGIMIAFQFLELYLKYWAMAAEIPLWYSLNWGEAQLAPKHYIYVIPIISILLLSSGLAFAIHAQRAYMRYGSNLILASISLYNYILTISLFRIIRITSLPTTPLFSQEFKILGAPFIASLVAVYIVAPRFIELLKEKEIVTDPSIHKHPSMLLKGPSARGGGLLVTCVISILAVYFVPLNRIFISIISSALLLALLGFFDDVQNTITTKLNFLENPNVRLGIQALIISLVLFAGVTIDFVNNPFDGTLFLQEYSLNIAGTNITPLPVIITLFWLLWMINLLSWSNGIDGQYAGIIGIASLVISIIALRDIQTDPNQINVAIMGMLIAGASFGLIKYTWHPSKIMWGFGATSAAFLLAAISILTRAKITVTIIALAVPFLDALITVGRRLLEGKNPLKGDRGHLQHLLLDRGWKIQSIALFYWATTALLGGLAIFSADRQIPILIFTVFGVIATAIIVLNAKSRKQKQQQLQVE